MKYFIVATGNPLYGLTLWETFTTMWHAVEWAEDNIRNEDWRIVTVEPTHKKEV